MQIGNFVNKKITMHQGEDEDEEESGLKLSFAQRPGPHAWARCKSAMGGCDATLTDMESVRFQVAKAAGRTYPRTPRGRGKVGLQLRLRHSAHRDSISGIVLRRGPAMLIRNGERSELPLPE